MIFKLIKYQFTLAIFLLASLAMAQDLAKDIEAYRLVEARRALNQMRFQSNLNTSNYDIVYNRLELKIDPSVVYIEGDVTAYFKAKENMDQIIFDLADNMVVSQVKQKDSSLSFEQNANDELVITLLETLSTGSLDSLTISYSGNPLSSGFGSFEQTSHNGHPIIWTLSEPYGAKAWWPCKQDLIDKIDSVDVILTTPRLNPNGGENVAVSNGLEKSQVVNGEFKTTEFNHRYPIPAYLVAIAVTNYSIYNHTAENGGNPFEIVNYVYPENLESAQASTAVTVDIMNLFSEKFGEYPFSEEKYGHAQFGWSGGMEHTTVSFMGNFSRNLIAHELAHQWYGNKVTCGSWQDIWLNEGFATYLSGLVYENLDGEEVFRNWREQVVEYITSEKNGSVHLKPQDTTSVRRIFDGRLSYYKGAMVLHMLRKKLGDETFFAGMKSYLNNPEYAFGYAKTPDFRLEMEAVSGMDLSEFFQDWVYGEGYPSYDVELANIRNGKILLNISQSQSHGSIEYFEAPLPLKLIGYNGEEKEITVVVDQDVEFLEIEVGFLVDQLIIDPDFDLISKENSTSLFEILYPPEITELAIFPNPIEDILQIQKPTDLQIHSVQIFNSLGQLIYNNDYESSIDLEHYKVGVYFLRLNTSDGIITKTLLKD